MTMAAKIRLSYESDNQDQHEHPVSLVGNVMGGRVLGTLLCGEEGMRTLYACNSSKVAARDGMGMFCTINSTVNVKPSRLEQESKNVVVGRQGVGRSEDSYLLTLSTGGRSCE